MIVVAPYSDEPLGDGNKGLNAKIVNPNSIQIDDKRFADELASLANIADAIAENENPGSSFQISEIALNLVLTAGGKLALLGSGVEGKAQASIKVKLARRVAEKSG
jgi:hypothetical protein